MTEPPNRSPCPRCGAPVTGEYKFCPTCACRLQSNATLEPEPVAPASRWPQLLLALVMGVLLAALIVVGWRLFGEPPARPPEREEDTFAGPFTVRNLRDRMVHLHEATATWQIAPDPEAGDWKVRVGDCLFGQYETTRGEYREFVVACMADPADVPDSLKALWRPEVEEDPAKDTLDQRTARKFANAYIDAWWARFAVYQKEAYEQRVRRPRDFVAPLPEYYGSLLAVPPSWARLTPREEFTWELPPGTEKLPVTDVCWYDAVAFAEWAGGVIGMPLRPPTEMEWIRAGNAGDPDRIYPWGDEPFPYACNSLSFWGQDERAALHRVDQPYADADGSTPEGIRQMSGNAREWLMNHELVPRVQDEYYSTALIDESFEETAPTIGGSFREALLDCTVDTDSVRYKDKFGRWDDVGFRLWAPSTWMGR